MSKTPEELAAYYRDRSQHWLGRYCAMEAAYRQALNLVLDTLPEGMGRRTRMDLANAARRVREQRIELRNLNRAYARLQEGATARGTCGSCAKEVQP